MTNLDKLIETLTQEELAETLQAVCINKNTFKPLDNEYSCNDCPFHNEDGSAPCGRRQTKWLLEEYKPPIDWTKCGKAIVIIDENSPCKGRIYIVNGVINGKVYLVDNVDKIGQTIKLPKREIPEWNVVIVDKQGVTYIMY